jgi:predicted  nucleic acid-binding Zn-ribbon protein
MAFEAIKSQIETLLERMENQPEDKHELYLQLHEKLNEWRATGQPIPEDLLELEQALEAEFAAELKR